MKTTRNSLRRSLGSIASLLMLFGCGQSGPLYLPTDADDAQQAPAAESEIAGEDDGDESNDDG